MRAGLAFLAVLLIAATVWILNPPASIRSTDPSDEVAAAESPPPRQPAQVDGAENPPPVVVERDIVDVPAAEPAAEDLEAEVGEPTPGFTRVRGTVVVVDPYGVQFHEESGRFEPFFGDRSWYTGGSPVIVENGRFEVLVPEENGLLVHDLQLGDQMVLLEESFFEVTGEPLVLRGRWPPVTTLRVVDKRTGLDLDEIEVVGDHGLGSGEILHPRSWAAPREVLVKGQASPFEITSEEGSDYEYDPRVLVGAPGYAWATTHLEFRKGGEHRVELEQGAGLEVRLQGELPRGRGVRSSGSFAGDDGSPQIRLRQVTVPEDLPSVEEVLDQVAVAPDSEFPGGVRPTEQEVMDQYAVMVEWMAAQRGPPVLEDRALGVP